MGDIDIMIEEQHHAGVSFSAANPPESLFPPAPWLFRGGSWVGLFRTDRPASLPDDVAPLFGSRWIVVALNRYLDGALPYDELIIGQIVRIGWRIGLYMPHIWVDNPASLEGGRRIWGLPKRAASFEWQGADVEIADETGPIAALRVNQHTAMLPRLPFLAPAFGCLEGTWTTFAAYGQARYGRAQLRLTAWSTRFPYRLSTRPTLGVAAKPFHLVVPPPKRLAGGRNCASV